MAGRPTAPAGSVVVAYPHRHASTTPQFQRCLRSLCVRDAYSHPGRIFADIAQESSSLIANGRCEIVRTFLDLGADWLLMLDDDMTFAPDLLDRLLEVADPVERPIIGGLCFGVAPRKGVPLRSTLGADLQGWPTLFTLADDGTLTHWTDYARDALIRVDSTGAACLLVHRSVLADERWTADGHPQPWFREGVFDGRALSEDHYFCLTAGRFGYPLHVHTGAQLGHVKHFVADQGWFDQAKRLQWVEPATEPVAVVVPVLGRPHRAAPFMASLRATTGLAEAFAVVDTDDTDTADAWEKAGAHVLVASGGSFPVKVNDGYRATAEPWLFVCGDDVRFHPGWLDQAVATHRASGARVIGTNDLGTDTVTSGSHATHWLIRRDYVDELGASWDGPGVVCHEGYRHAFVDNEVVTVAKQRDEWAHCGASVVEHLHPAFGRADDDATYELGRASYAADHATWERRYGERVP
jgi:hypothetical protein